MACSADTFVSNDAGQEAGPISGDGAADATPEAAPPLTCDAGQTACTGTCVDTQSDTKNCGACGHDCLGGDCTLGKCQPFTIAQNQFQVTVLAPTATQLYWSRDVTGVQNGGIFVADLDGQNEAKLFDAGGGSCSGLLVDGADSYFFCTGAIYHCALPSCPSGPTTLVPITDVVDAALDKTNSRIYFSVKTLYDAQTGGYVGWIPTTGGGAPSRIVAADQLNPHEIFLDNGVLYWLDYGTYKNDVAQYNGGVRSAPLGTNQTMSVLVNDFTDLNFSGLTVSGNTVYYGAGSSIMSTATSGGLVATFTPSGAGQIIADATYLYWTDAGASVYRCAKTSCTTPTTLATGENYPVAIAQDAVSIYWADYFGGQIRRLAK
jgi:hypothetical protein